MTQRVSTDVVDDNVWRAKIYNERHILFCFDFYRFKGIVSIWKTQQFFFNGNRLLLNRRGVYDISKLE